MKKNTLFVVLIAGTVFFSSGLSRPDSPFKAKTNFVFDESKEFEAVMKVIEAETSYFFFRDYEGWKNQWIQADYVFHGWNNSDGSCGTSIGWHAVDEKIGNYIKNNPVEGDGSSHPEVNRKNIRYHFLGQDAVHLIWEQYNSTSDLSAYNLSHEVRTLEKVNGEWKIVQVSAFWDYINTVPSEKMK
ncbi:MAG: hypothetical protein LC658_03645 [Bacteroidales bacterium]|nr:hypothetical protein [Bacteroidales bacterium]